MMGYPRQIVRTTVGRHRHQLALDGGRRFTARISPSSVEGRQVQLFNKAWEKSLTTPFYQYWSDRHSLPDSISDLADLDSWPILTKDHLRGKADLVKSTPGMVGAFTTSGSSSEPFSFPRGEGEFDALYRDAWSYRVANGLQPFDGFVVMTNTARSASVSGLAQLKSRLARQVKDLAGNSWSTNGFIADNADADKAIASVRFHRPKYVIGFTSALAVVGRRALDRGVRFPSVEKVIPTSETVDMADIDVMQRAFGAEVLIEYGAIELGVVAGTPQGASGWPLRVNWWSTLVRLDNDSGAVCTTLNDRAFPLINYSIGDVIGAGQTGPGGSILTINQIEGRTKDVVEVALRDGTSKHIRARQLVNLVRELDGIESVQIAPQRDGRADIIIAAPVADPGRIARHAAASIRRNVPEIEPGALRLRFVDRHIPGARGKRGILVDPSRVAETLPSTII